VIIPEGETDAGEIFSLTYCPSLSTVYFGCQNTSLQWFDLSQATKFKSKGGSPVRNSNGTTILPSKRWHKFFDSVPQPARTVNGSPTSTTGSTTPDRQLVHSLGDPAEAVCASLRFTSIDAGPKALQVPPQNVILPAQYGYIYCMALSPSHLYSGDYRQRDQDIFLLTGSGDEDVKVRSQALNFLSPYAELSP
jgi:di- and tripeptidase